MSHFNFYYSSIFPVKAVRIPPTTVNVASLKTRNRLRTIEQTITKNIKIPRKENFIVWFLCFFCDDSNEYKTIIHCSVSVG